MDAEDVLTLLDHYWFNQEIITKKPSFTHLKAPISPPPPQIQIEPPKPEISRVTSRHIRSHSDQFTSKINPVVADFDSPKSVLLTHRLQTILSGKRVSEVEEEEIEEPHFIDDDSKKKKNLMMGMKRRRNRGSSKSLSDLEFDELQGFMDLGFKFSEEDKNSVTLISIVPGLQRFGKKDNHNNNGDSENHEGVLISRPYLSESWDVLDKRRNKQAAAAPLINWKVPNLGNDIDMKDQLKFWAHTIASTVR